MNNKESQDLAMHHEKALLSKEHSTRINTGSNVTGNGSERNYNSDTVMRHKAEETDGPWSVAVALVSFIAQGLLGGYCYTGGIFYTIFLNEFPQVDTVAISWLCTMPLTLWFSGSLIGTMIINKFGCRMCAMIGGIMAFLGLSLCYFASEFYLVFLFYGIIAGIGNGIHYVGFITAVGRYFNKYRPIASILTTTGLTFGMAIYSFLVPRLTQHYTWKETLLILGGISFNVCACACVLFPITKTSVRRQIFNLSILKKKHFLLFCGQCLFCNISNGMTLLHVPAKILSVGLGSNIVSLSLTVYGGCNCIAKIILSIWGHFSRSDVILVYTMSLTICGIATAIFPVTGSKVFVVCIVGFIGLTYSVCGGHYLEVTLELAGQDNFADGLGVAQSMKACGTLVAGPLAGVLFKETMDYNLTFYISGSAMMIGNLLMLPIILRKNRRPSIRNVEYKYPQ